MGASFNEAGATKPRVRAVAASVVAFLLSFNEAGATKPRVRPRRFGQCIPNWGFNEAGATKPRVHRGAHFDELLTGLLQ